MTKRKLPEWAADALDAYRPVNPSHGLPPNADRLGSWEALRDRLSCRWLELDADCWRVGANGDTIRGQILESAIECALDYVRGKTPARAVAALRQLDELNEAIGRTAAQLAELVSIHRQIRESEGGDDWPHDAPDPLDLWSWVGELNADDLEVARLARLVFTINRPLPGLEDLLQAIADRHPAPANRLWSADRREVFSRKTVGWAPIARRLMATLERRGHWLGVNLLDALTPEQMASLLCVTLDAPAEAFSADAVKALKTRYKRRT